MATTGERIRAARTGAKMTQAQLAEKVGLSEPAVRLYELDKRTPKPAILTAFAGVLGVTPESLEDRGIASVQDVMESLFQMEEAGFGVKPVQIDGNTVIAIDPNAPHAAELTKALEEWQRVHAAMDSQQESKYEYGVWRMSFEG